jgi:transposase
LPAAPSIIREDCFKLLHVFDEQIRDLDIQLTQAWGADPRVRRLTSVPGIGPFIATVLVLELGEIHRFPSAKHLASYVGLTPRIHASAERTRTGHISKEGNRLLRWVLVLAATQASRRPGPLRAWYRAVQKRRGRNAARVALARRLAEIVYQLWKTETTYDVLQTRSRAGVSPLG